jgi:radical SAM superfamily enzyme YgiQ (UPF0313 family)
LTAARWIRQAGFIPHVDFVFGFPGETLEDRRLSVQMMGSMIEETGAKIHAHTFMPLPGTPLFQKEPSRLDAGTKNELRNWEQKRKLDGWWEEQEERAWKIVEWRDQGLIGTQVGTAHQGGSFAAGSEKEETQGGEGIGAEGSGQIFPGPKGPPDSQ